MRRSYLSVAADGRCAPYSIRCIYGWKISGLAVWAHRMLFPALPLGCVQICIMPNDGMGGTNFLRLLSIYILCVFARVWCMFRWTERVSRTHTIYAERFHKSGCICGKSQRAAECVYVRFNPRACCHRRNRTRSSFPSSLGRRWVLCIHTRGYALLGFEHVMQTARAMPFKGHYCIMRGQKAHFAEIYFT